MDKKTILQNFKDGKISYEDALVQLEELESSAGENFSYSAKENQAKGKSSDVMDENDADDLARLLTMLPEDQEISTMIIGLVKKGVNVKKIGELIAYMPENKERYKFILSEIQTGLPIDKVLAVIPYVSPDSEHFGRVLSILRNKVDAKEILIIVPHFNVEKPLIDFIFDALYNRVKADDIVQVIDILPQDVEISRQIFITLKAGVSGEALRKIIPNLPANRATAFEILSAMSSKARSGGTRQQSGPSYNRDYKADAKEYAKKFSQKAEEYGKKAEEFVKKAANKPDFDFSSLGKMFEDFGRQVEKNVSTWAAGADKYVHDIFDEKKGADASGIREGDVIKLKIKGINAIDTDFYQMVNFRKTPINVEIMPSADDDTDIEVYAPKGFDVEKIYKAEDGQTRDIYCSGGILRVSSDYIYGLNGIDLPIVVDKNKKIIIRVPNHTKANIKHSYIGDINCQVLFSHMNIKNSTSNTSYFEGAENAKIEVSAACKLNVKQITNQGDINCSGASRLYIENIAGESYVSRIIGASTATIGKVNANSFHLEAAGASTANVDELKASNLNLGASGASTVNVKSGEVDKASCMASGASNIWAGSTMTEGVFNASGASRIGAAWVKRNVVKSSSGGSSVRITREGE